MNPRNLSLTRAVTEGDTEAVRALLAAGSDVNGTTSGGQTPLIIAIVFRRTLILSLLLEAGADPQLRDGLGLNAVDWAERRGFSEGLGLLIQSQPGKQTPADTLGTQPTPHGKAVPPAVEKPSAPRESQQFALSDEKSRRWIAGMRRRIEEEEGHKTNEGQPVPPTFEIEEASVKQAPAVVDNDQAVSASPTVPKPEVIAASPDLVTNVAPEASLNEGTLAAQVIEPVVPRAPALRKEPPRVVDGDQPVSASATVPKPSVNAAAPPDPSSVAAQSAHTTNLAPETLRREEALAAQVTNPVVPRPEALRSQSWSTTTRSPSIASNRKRCPKCSAVYDSELLTYCATDLTPLVDVNSPLVASPPETPRMPLIWLLLVLVFMVSAGVTYLIMPRFETARDVQPEALPTQVLPVRNRPQVAGGLSGKEVDVPEPEYPVSARSEHVSGTVTMRVSVDKKGRVIKVKVVEGDWRLRKAAIAAAQKATFSPEKLMGRGAVGTIAYTFKE